MRWIAGPLALLLAALAMPPRAEAGPALLLDAATGHVLYAEDQDDLWHPASLTKIMTAYLTFEALKAGKLTLEGKITNSENASLQAPSKVGLPVGAEITVDMALRALIIKSANDVAVMLAEAIAGSEPAFVEQMNAAAKKLGMTRTTFVNPSGLPAPEQVTTARDLAKLSRAVLVRFPEHAHYWTMADMHIGKRRIPTHNGLLRTFDGADGIKTGFICDSGYNVVATATRDGRKLLAVVLGEPTGRDRNIRAASLLDHGFQTHGWKMLFNAASIDRMPIPAESRGISSVRQQVMNFSCNGRRGRPAAVIAKARQERAKAAKAAKAGNAEAGDAVQATATGETATAKPAVRQAAKQAAPAKQPAQAKAQ
jgi:D-alanyl-D-alanine carboxypeptidase